MKEHYPNKVWRFCQFCGSKELSWQGTSKMSCNSCDRSFYINESAAVVAIIKNEKDEYLFTVRDREPGAGLLDFPGGFVDLGESAEKAVKREIMEELGLEITQLKFYKSLPNRYLFGEMVYFTLDLVFICEVKTLNVIEAKDDVAGYRFIDIKEVDLDEIGLESIRELVESLKN